MQAPSLIPVQTDAATRADGGKGLSRPYSEHSGQSGPFEIHLNRQESSHAQQPEVGVESSLSEPAKKAAEIAECEQDAPGQEETGLAASPEESEVPNGMVAGHEPKEQQALATAPAQAATPEGSAVEQARLSLRGEAAGHNALQQEGRAQGQSVSSTEARQGGMLGAQGQDGRGLPVSEGAKASSAGEVSLPEAKPVSSMRSLTELLEAGSVRLDRSSQSAVEPAVARARVVQQAIAQEQFAQAAQQAIRNAAPGAQGLPNSGVHGVATASGDVRGAVLSEVLARTGEMTQSGERATTIAARGLTALASQRGGSLAIRLDPPSLGEIAIRMNVVDGVVRAELTAANSAARVLMDKSIDVLRCALESRGLTVERLSIHGPIMSEHSGRMEGQQSQTEQQGGAREEGAGGEENDAAGHQSRGRGNERQDQVFDEQGSSRGSRVSFQQVLDEDTT